MYDELADDKRNVEGQRNYMYQVRDNKFDDFKGNVYDNRYLSQINNIVDAYNLDGPLGFLEKGINRLNTRLENWVN